MMGKFQTISDCCASSILFSNSNRRTTKPWGTSCLNWLPGSSKQLRLSRHERMKDLRPTSEIRRNEISMNGWPMSEKPKPKALVFQYPHETYFWPRQNLFWAYSDLDSIWWREYFDFDSISPISPLGMPLIIWARFSIHYFHVIVNGRSTCRIRYWKPLPKIWIWNMPLHQVCTLADLSFRNDPDLNTRELPEINWQIYAIYRHLCTHIFKREIFKISVAEHFSF